MAFNIKDFSKEAIDDIQNAIGEMINIQTEKRYRAAMAAAAAEASKSVTVKIADEDFIALKDSGYNLCFAKKVGDAEYNIIWKSLNTKQYAKLNTLSWVPEYQIFATQTFQAGSTIKAEYGPADIGLGQIVTIDSYGNFTSPIDGGNAGEVKIQNEYTDIKFGLAQKCSTGGSTGLLPIFVDNLHTRLGDITMEPIDKIMVWFQSKAETSAVFVDKKSKFIEVELRGNKTSIEITYKDSNWKVTG